MQRIILNIFVYRNISPGHICHEFGSYFLLMILSICKSGREKSPAKKKFICLGNLIEGFYCN